MNAVQRPEQHVAEELQDDVSEAVPEDNNSEEASQFVSTVVYNLTVGRVRFVREYPLKIEYDTYVGGQEKKLARNVETQTDDKYINEHIENLCREMFAKLQTQNTQSESMVTCDRNADKLLKRQLQQKEPITGDRAKEDNIEPKIKSERLDK